MKINRNILKVLVAASFTVAIAVGICFWSFDKIQQASDNRKHAFQVLSQADGLLSSLKDAETGQRGFLLTDDETYLEPYIAVRHSIAEDLYRLYKTNTISAANKHLDAASPLILSKLDELEHSIAHHRANKIDINIVENDTGLGKHSMDLIRNHILAFRTIEQEQLMVSDAAFEASMRNMFALIITASLFFSLFALTFIYFMIRESQQKIKNLVYKETQHLLEIQEESNKELRQLNANLQASEEKMTVTLSSIGDAVITTDANACVTLLNPLAEQLTGWIQAQAIGRPISEVFTIINKETRLPSTIPVTETLQNGTVHGLANHTVLIAVDGIEYDIADSCAPIRGRDGDVVGAVLVFRNVSAEYAIQQALRDNTAFIETIINTVADGIITLHARDGIIESANNKAQLMFDFIEAELIGLNFSVLIPELDQEQRNGSLKHYSASDENRAVGIGREVIGWRKGDQPFPLEITVSEMWLGGERYFTCILRDITARRLAEAAEIKASALQNAIFNSANFSSIATDAMGVIQIFNVGAERMLGYAASEVMNKITPAEISDPEELIARAEKLSLELKSSIKPGFEALAFKASRGIEDIYELTYIRKDGKRLPAMVSVTALRDSQAAIIGYLLIGTDNTSRKQVEAERELLDLALQHKNEELEQATFVAEKANQAKSNFLSSMSHELRTPLGAILGFAQLLESGMPAPTIKQKKSIDQILKAGWYLLELINEVLDLALIESGKLALSMETVILNDVMSECEAMIEPKAEKHGIKVTFNKSEPAYYIKGDRTRVKQIVINLLSNAIKYNRLNGSVNITWDVSSNNNIRICVQDTGPGMTPEQQSQLFQPFNRLDKNSKEEGTGIGLVVCKRLVELMHGRIGVDSVVGVGSVFWIELEEALEPQVSTLSEISEKLELLQLHTKLYTLLYVEDNPANLMLVSDIMSRRKDVHLLSASNAKQGIKLARAHQPDVILMDINLPGLSGYEALKMLLKDQRTSQIPIVALSANAMPNDIEKGLKAGFFDYLTKPIKVKEFMDKMNLALNYSQTIKIQLVQKDQV